MREWLEGMSVSVDVSTGDHDEQHRYFGTVTEVMDAPADKHGVTLLVQDAEPNFAAPAAPAKLCNHDLFKTGDADAPEQVKDRNGEVVLAMCRKCGKAESELPTQGAEE